VVFAPRAQSVSEASGRSRKIFEAAGSAESAPGRGGVAGGIFCSGPWCDEEGPGESDVLRSVLMKPEHKEWVGRIWEILGEATARLWDAEAHLECGSFAPAFTAPGYSSH